MALSEVGLDLFAYYARQVKDLVTESKHPSLPFEARTKDGDARHSDCLFEGSVEAGLSDSRRRERLHALLRRAVETLTPEIDEMLDPVANMRQLQLEIQSKKVLFGACPMATDGAEKVKTARNPRQCYKCCSNSSTTEWVIGPERKLFCGACGAGAENGSESCSILTPSTRNVSKEEDDDLRWLLENDSSIVEETVKEYSDKLISTLDHMETHLETVLDTLMSACRPMTLTEKRRLQQLIQMLPPKNLNRVAEIVQQRKPVQQEVNNEIHVNLEKEDNATLWRLYYYVKAVEKARILLMKKMPNSNAPQ